MARKRSTSSAIREPLARALGTLAKVAALRALCGTDEPISQRDLARRSGVQHRSIQIALDDLVILGIVSRLHGGRDYLVQLNTQHRLAAPLRALFAAEAGNFLAVRRELSTFATTIAARTRLVNLALFGSVARAQDLPGSDCDLILIARDQKGLDAALVELAAVAALLDERYGVRIRPIGYTRADATARWKKNEAPFPGIREDGLVLFGSPLNKTLHDPD
jgi:predicted nucleotidyltransferase